MGERYYSIDAEHFDVWKRQLRYGADRVVCILPVSEWVGNATDDVVERDVMVAGDQQNLRTEVLEDVASLFKLGFPCAKSQVTGNNDSIGHECVVQVDETKNTSAPVSFPAVNITAKQDPVSAAGSHEDQ